jgi:hypoxanthine phosphoribosyltransferase
MTVFTNIGHEELVDHVQALAVQLAQDRAWIPDFIIGIGRGGLVPAVYLSHATGLSMLSVDYSSQVKDFADESLATLARRTQAGERLLFLDDINDSGRTIGHIRGTLFAAGAAPGNVRFATLLDNVSSAEKVEYRARTIDRTVTKDWFVFPWEAVAPAEALVADAAAVPDRIA